MVAQVIVVGGGLAGVSAAHSALQNGARVLLLDKKQILGGNSVKATSGINGGGTRIQKKLGVPDTKEIFEEDTMRSATGIKQGKLPPTYELARVLTHQSAPAVEWLNDSFGLNLDTVSRLGGHSQPRTHRAGAGGKFPGMMITYALMEKLEELAEKTPDKVRVITKANVYKLLVDAKGEVVGCEYEKDGKKHSELGAVVVCTGGYGAGGLSQNSLLHKIRPDLVHLPTTNGDHCNGDGIEFCTAVGAACVDLRHVQVHPTGLVHFKDPNSKTKFLAAEALRGEGAILLDKNGRRFCNDIGTRDYVTMSMWKNEGPFFLVLNGKASSKIAWHCRHYTGRGVMKAYTSIRDFAKEFNMDVDIIKQTFDEYNISAKTGVDKFGLKFFDAAPLKLEDTFHIAMVTPVVHYTMGGIYIDGRAGVISAKTKKAIPGLYSAGEATGGVHGRNRLGGSALAECVVFGRVSGRSAAEHVLAGGSSGRPVDAPPMKVDLQAMAQVDSQPGMEISTIPPDSHWKKGAAASSSSSSSSAAASSGGKKGGATAGGKKTYTLAEVAKHTTEDDCWCVVNGKVLDVTKFLNEHPGGKMAIMTFAGKDASEEFNMLHEDNVIAKYAPETIIGTLAPGSKL